MAFSNFERMIQLAEDVFATRSDPDQIDVDQQVILRLQRIHPATVSEYNDGKGPVVWVLIIPTTTEIMNQFLQHKITERELLVLTPADITYESLYLCSALVLEEYRHQGIAKRLAVEAIVQICKDHPLKSLFVWPFTKQGDALAENIARNVTLPLYKKTDIK